MTKLKGSVEFIDKLTRLERLPKELAAELKPEIEDDLRSNYDAERDPYGSKWAARKHEPRDGHAILFDSGRQYGSLRLQLKGDGEIDVSYNTPYSVFHQTGTDHMAQRLLVPTAAKGIPPRWLTLTNDAFKHKLEELLRG